ncbi:hypothetical protein HDU91_005374 [Kappamyces sp. JEL0680]|nr:hypothetical protein HDU91_005374 [Kappamyces sp. JEL0680]
MLPRLRNPLRLILLPLRTAAQAPTARFHSLPVSLREGGKDREKVSALDFLAETYDEKVEEIHSENMEVPPNVDEAFFVKYDKLSKSLSGDGAVSLSINSGFPLVTELAATAKSSDELLLVRSLIEMWIRAGRSFTKSKSVHLLDALLSNGHFNLVFESLCDKNVYGLKPESGHITKLIRHYAAQAMETELPEPQRLEHLDLAFKSFALYLYYDIPPTVSSYNMLIAAGLYGSTQEGRKRSNMTLDEMKSLGWTPNLDASHLSTLFGTSFEGKRIQHDG